MHPLVIFGVTGRMGQSLLRALPETPGLRLAAAVASPQSNRLGQDAAAAGPACGVPVTADAAQALSGASVAVDFSLASAVYAHTAACAARGIPLLVGATGLDAETRRLLESAAERIAVLVAANTSIGIAVLTQLAARATAALGSGYDVEILESHHRMKRDAPSGTALALGEAVAAARGQTLEETAVLGRRTEAGLRETPSIGFAVLRAGDIVGEHTVLFAGDGERIELTHRAGDRMIFARGALRAAEWLVARRPGLYGMRDVLEA